MTLKTIIFFLALFVFVPLAVTVAADKAEKTVFLQNISDMPLMPGLNETKEAGVSFDKPEGRIVEAMASGPVPFKAVRSFYRSTLPSLGWENLSPDVWRRQNEILKIDYQHTNSVTFVHFTVSPEKQEKK